MSKVPVMAAVNAADAFRRENTRRAIGPLCLVAGGAVVAALGDLSGQNWARTVGSSIEIAAWVMAGGALMRLAFIDEHPGDAAFQPGRQGFQWNAQEWRYAAASAVQGVAVIVALGAPAAFAIMLAGLFGGIADNAKPAAAAILIGGGLIAVVLGAFISTRLSLCRAASVSSQRFAMGWDLTKGQVWPIFAAFALLLLALFAMMLMILLPLTVLASTVGVFGDAAHSGARLSAMRTLVVGLIVAFLQTPFSVGLEAYLYRGLRSEPS